MNRFSVLVTYAFVGIGLPNLSAQPVVSDQVVDFLVRDTVSQLGTVKLSADQLTQVKTLAANAAPQIRDAELQAEETDAQRRAREEATAQAVKNGLRGAAARKLIMGATSRTPGQRAAFERAAKIRREFDQAVFALLTAEQRLEAQEPGPRVDVSSGFLVVQLSPELPLPPASAKTLKDAAEKLNLTKLSKVIDEYRLTNSARAVNPELLDRLDNAANQAATNEIRLLRTFWEIDISKIDKEDEKTALVVVFNGIPGVEDAYLGEELGVPSSSSGVDPSDDPKFPRQGYLAPAPLGIDAAAAWNIIGGQGAGVGLADLEWSWNIAHEDLSAILRHEPVYGERVPGGDNHGTSAVGQIVAQDNSVGVVGAAPSVEYVALSSLYHASNRTFDRNIANALLAVVFIMDPGDVLLVELQCLPSKRPAEAAKLNYHAIRVAVLLGMVVIEPAGDAGQDLDAFRNGDGLAILNRNSPDFRDSGAIMVGASDPIQGHNKARGSCYGSRVDCFGWGNNVVTTGCGRIADCFDTGGGNVNRSYRSMFCATSSAAPVVAGAAILVQGLFKTNHSVILSSSQMRSILSNPRTGTPQGTAAAGHIGVMPNLKAIIAAYELDCCSGTGPCSNHRTRRGHYRSSRRAVSNRRR